MQDQLIKKWVLFGFAVTAIDQFLFVCLSWLVFSDLSSSLAATFLTGISLLRLIGLTLAPRLGRRLDSLSVTHLGVAGRVIAFVLLFLAAVLPIHIGILVGALALFALSDGLFIPASALTLRHLSRNSDYLRTLALMQMALNLSLACAALLGGAALEYLSQTAVALLLLCSSVLTYVYFGVLRRRVRAINVIVRTPVTELRSVVWAALRSWPILSLIIQIVLLELTLAGMLNILLPSLFTQRGYGSINFSIAIALFITAGIAAAASLRFFPSLTGRQFFRPGVLFLITVGCCVLLGDSLPWFLLGFMIFGAGGSLLAPYLTNKIIGQAKPEDEAAYFSILSLTSYGTIFVSYAFWGALIVHLSTHALFVGSALVFGIYGLCALIQSFRPAH